MLFKTNKFKTTFAGLCLMSALLLEASNALAAVTITIKESGNDVVATADGTINTSGLIQNPSRETFTASVKPLYASVMVGPNTSNNWAVNFTKAIYSIGSAYINIKPSESTGEPFGISGYDRRIIIRSGYVSGERTWGKSIFANKKLADLGFEPGEYKFEWGSGTSVDSVTIIVEAAPSNAAPFASSVSISGTPQSGTPLGSSSSWGDAEGDEEGVSTFRWVRNSTNTGVSGGSTVGTSATYTPVTADIGAYLYFCVTPVAKTGTSPGAEACSPASPAVVAATVHGECGTAANTAASILPSNNLCTAGTAGQVSSSQGQYSWTCSGTDGGTHASCTAPWASKAGTGSGSLTASGNNWTVSSASFAATPTATPPAGVTFPNGLLDLRLTTGTSGTDATVVVQYTTAVPAGAVYMKYGKTAANPTDHWYQLAANRAVFASDRMSVTLTLTDGGAGDNDLLANGVIVDPGGPALVAAPTAIPTLSEWAMILMASLMGLFAFTRIRRQS